MGDNRSLLGDRNPDPGYPFNEVIPVKTTLYPFDQVFFIPSCCLLRNQEADMAVPIPFTQFLLYPWQAVEDQLFFSLFP